MNRRDLILGGAMAAAATAAAALTPRERLVLLGDRRIETIVPRKIGDWTNVPSSAFILPKNPGSLSDRLYNQTISRLYESPTREPVMLVIAYGSIQNDLLQLHRPETCYAAVGFAISNSTVADVTLGSGALPVRELVASSDQRVEPIAYWTRIGDDLPTDGRQQRWVRFQQQVHGLVPDGVLVRVSTVAAAGTPDVFAGLREFAAAMIHAMRPADRAALIGRPLAAAMPR